MGKHDLLVPSCDSVLYLAAGHPGHPNCRDNYTKALREFGIQLPVPLDPINIFQNTTWDDSGALEMRDALSRAGDYILFEALADLIVAVSACPFDLGPANGNEPTDLMLEVFEG